MRKLIKTGYGNFITDIYPVQLSARYQRGLESLDNVVDNALEVERRDLGHEGVQFLVGRTIEKRDVDAYLAGKQVRERFLLMSFQRPGKKNGRTLTTCNLINAWIDVDFIALVQTYLKYQQDLPIVLPSGYGKDEAIRGYIPEININTAVSH